MVVLVLAAASAGAQSADVLQKAENAEAAKLESWTNE